MSRRGVTAIGLLAAGGAGYYLYNAGGDPKAAEKLAEADAHKASAKIRGEVEPRGREAGARGEAAIRQAGDKFDNAVSNVVSSTQSSLHDIAGDAQKRFEQSKRDAQKALEEGRKEAHDVAAKASAEAKREIDAFDKNVTEGAQKAKSGISSWFGGK